MNNTEPVSKETPSVADDGKVATVEQSNPGNGVEHSAPAQEQKKRIRRGGPRPTVRVSIHDAESGNEIAGLHLSGQSNGIAVRDFLGKYVKEIDGKAVYYKASFTKEL